MLKLFIAITVAIIIIFIIGIFVLKHKEKYTSNSNYICLVTLRPTVIWCDFLNKFTKYKIFIIVDDNKFELYDFKNKYKNINFIQIEDEKCKLAGYIDTNFTLKKLISGWDKALYYFGVENTNYDFIWFIEDDVFFYDEYTLTQIDDTYVDDDLLSKVFDENKDGKKNYWHWHRINIQQYPPPYYCTMVCAVRFSKKMMPSINDYANKHKTLFFLEALFPTIAVKNNLKYNNPMEFKNIHYIPIFEKKDINNNDLYHPVKDVNDHISLREL